MQRCATCLLLVFLAVPVASAELAGVTLADSVSVGDQTLVLNGLGLREKFVIKVYVGGLYLPAEESDSARILSADTPRRMVMEFGYDVSAGQLCDSWNDGLAADTPGASAELQGQFATLCGWMADGGERLSFTYQPGEGTTVEVGGTVAGRIPGKQFADALLACWLGPAAPPGGFKSGILGD